MKNILKSFALVAVIITSIIAIGFSGNQDNEIKPYSPGKLINNIRKVSEEINSIKLTNSFENVNLFRFKQHPVNSKHQNDVLAKASNLVLDNGNLKNFLTHPKQNIVFRIPVSGTGFVELELTRANIFSTDARFSTITSAGKIPFDYKPGIYYKGIIKGDNNSVAAVSIFDNNVIGIISDRSENYVLGKIDDKVNTAEEYVFYKESDLKVKNKFVCKVNDFDERFLKSSHNAVHDAAKIKENNPDYINSVIPVRMYYEADYAMTLKFNRYPRYCWDIITAEFVFIQEIYQNEQIASSLSEIAIWTIPDPYIEKNDAYSILTTFGAENKDNFNGNLAQLLSARDDQNFGGIGWINVLCQPYDPQDSSGRYSFANLDTLLYGYPDYNWNVEVMTHEMGHNIGSKHTHACVWPIVPGNPNIIGAIDSCYFAEGNCFTQTQPNYSGTIMSYCHLNGAIHLGNGFGPLPGDTIRYTYTQAGCMLIYTHISEIPFTFILEQNFPNPFNPVTKIGYAVPKNAYITLKIYDITGREIATLVNNQFYAAGYYDVSFSAADYSLASGVYFYKLQASDASSGSNIFTQVKKMILTK